MFSEASKFQPDFILRLELMQVGASARATPPADGAEPVVAMTPLTALGLTSTAPFDYDPDAVARLHASQPLGMEDPARLDAHTISGDAGVVARIGALEVVSLE